MRADRSPIVRLMKRASLSRIDVAQRAKVSLPTIDKICRDADDVLTMKLETLMKVSIALGCAACELWPELAQRPDRGLLWERRVFVTPKKSTSAVIHD